jgi:hypothetical protein
MACRLSTPIALLLAMVLTPVMAAESDSALARERGQYRPLIVIARSSADPSLVALQRALTDPATHKAFLDRKMVLYTVVGTMGQRDGKNLETQTTMGMIRELDPGVSDAMRVILVGLDGQKKVVDKGDVDLNKLFAVIDAMPMAEKDAVAPPPAPAKAAPAGKPGKGAKPGKAAPAEAEPAPAALDD